MSTVPSQRSAPTTTTAADDSRTQRVDQTQASAAASNDEQDPSEAPPKRKQKRKRKQSKLPPPHQRRMVQAIGRIEGRIIPAGNGIKIVTADGSAFRVSSVGKSALALRLLGLSDSERSGRYAFWPAFHKEGIVLVSFNNAEEWEPQKHSPPVDEMFVCGTLQEIESERFSVLVGYGYSKQKERYERLLWVESAPLSEWRQGQWVDLILRREGEGWQWRGEFHPRGPQVGGNFNSWLPYIETAVTERNEAKVQAE